MSAGEMIIPKEDRVSRELVLEELKGPLDLAQIFGNDKPVELEIGIGKGYFIRNAALATPDINFIGIEIRRKFLNLAKERVEKRPIENVRFVCGEAYSFMKEFLGPQSLSAVHLYFPDPWPKARHHKRRIFNQHFIQEAYDVLKPGGLLLVATDHKGYWEHMQEVLEAQTLLEPTNVVPEPASGTKGLTNYEIKYIIEGREIYRTGYRKPDAV